MSTLGKILIDRGVMTGSDLIVATAMQVRQDADLGDILLANNMVSEAQLYSGLAKQYGCATADLNAEPPDIRLVAGIDPSFCIKNRIIPWKRVGAVTLIATSRPEHFAGIMAKLPDEFGSVMMVVAPLSAINQSLLHFRHHSLAKRAESRVDPTESCRDWNTRSVTTMALLLLAVLITVAFVAPFALLLVLIGCGIAALVLNTGLKAAAALASYYGAPLTAPTFLSARRPNQMMRLPKVSILVPLFRERRIANRLVRRLGRLNYPRELLEICLIVEQDDTTTQSALKEANLPAWMRQITVPRGELKTKPRALNFALDFCNGAIIGVYDAEDAPEADQLFKVARRFHEAGPKVACLQGVLDFYNPTTNWISRCFTIEYASWFRVVLPGLQQLGLVIPLGGTTLFFRRDALEKIGGWDAHNVTEDADLGIRLARRGYKTELIATLTKEEANCETWPWIRQRSRWLKGYAITWAVHMRSPRALIRDLGLKRFIGVQIIFLGTLTQFILAPVLWSFWAVPLGIYHPIQSVLSPTAFYLLTGMFFMSEIITLLIGIFALAPTGHKRLWMWIPTLHMYFGLAVIAAYKGIWELFSKPFYWDKTAHGVVSSTPPKDSGTSIHT